MPGQVWDCPRCGALARARCRTAGDKLTNDHSARFTTEAKQQTAARLYAEERGRARARWLEHSRTR